MQRRSARPSAGLDRDDPRVRAARTAEARAYEHYGRDFEEHFVDVEALGGRVRVVEVGDGPPVVAIPGGTGNGLVWLPLLPELRGYTVYVVDRPGGGLSDGIDHRSNPLAREAATSTAGVFDHFGLDTAPVIGNSMGGLWALRFALAHPGRVSAIALLGCPALFPGTSAPLPMRLLSLPWVGELLVGRLLRTHDADDARETWGFLGHPSETAERLPPAFAEAWYRMDQVPGFERSWVSLLQSALRPWGAAPEAAFTPRDLRAVAAPVTLVWGREDPFGSVEQGREGAEFIPEAEFHEVGTGHLPWLDEPERCGELVRARIDSHR